MQKSHQKPCHSEPQAKNLPGLWEILRAEALRMTTWAEALRMTKPPRHSEPQAKNLPAQGDPSVAVAPVRMTTWAEALRMTTWAKALRMTNTTPPFMSEYGKINRPNSDERSEVFVY